MVEENDFLQWARIHFAINAKLQRHLCHPVWFASGVDSESVRFALCHPGDGILHRCHQEEIGAHDQGQKRKTSRISDSAVPQRSPHFGPGIEQRARDAKPRRIRTRVNHQFYSMIQDVVPISCAMTDLISGSAIASGLSFSSSCAKKAGDIGAHAFGLSRCVHFENLFDRDFVRLHHRRMGFLIAGIIQRFVGIEERGICRAGDKTGEKRRPPRLRSQPPCARSASEKTA